MLIFLVSLPRGAVLFAMLATLACVMWHFLALGDFGNAAKAILPGAGVAILFWLRVRSRAG